MPIYEYNCQKCKVDFEQLVRGGEQAACPGCDSLNVERLLSVSAAPKTNGASLPIRGSESDAGCGATRCCGGRCS